ncbi:MAG: DUF2190 family protein [Verrucomicrobia bacterium]|nr:DUF2190 family protein [Verrucomicrobiota bacterium]
MFLHETPALTGPKMSHENAEPSQEAHQTGTLKDTQPIDTRAGLLSRLSGFFRRRNRIRLANENARHGYAITKYSTGSISQRWLLGQLHTDTTQIKPCALASAMPLGIITDEASAAGETVAVELLGAIPGTIRAVAAGAVSAGEAVYTAASGRVQSLPSAAGTYYQVGVSLTAAAASGDEIEIITCVPRKLVVEQPV